MTAAPDPRTPDAAECDNYLPPMTCLTAPSSVTGRCDKCKARTPDAARGGTCSTCGGDLVQTPGRTYHPAATSDPTNPCPDLLPIPGTDALSFNVPPDRFVPTPDHQPDAPTREGVLTEEELESLAHWDDGDYSCACTSEGPCKNLPCQNERDDLTLTVARIVAAHEAAALREAAEALRQAERDGYVFLTNTTGTVRVPWEAVALWLDDRAGGAR
jgi:hypothetical protein